MMPPHPAPGLVIQIMINSVNATIATNLSALIATQNLTNDDLVDKSGVCANAIESFLSGHGGRVIDLCWLATVLEVQPVSLLTPHAGDLAIVLDVLISKRGNNSEFEIGTRLACQRKLAGKTQADVADAVNIPRQEISRIESGLREIKCDQLAAIAVFLGCPVDLFLPAIPIGKGDLELAIQIVAGIISNS